MAPATKSKDRRPVHYWSKFNSWWRQVLEADGRRPNSAAIAKWYEEHAHNTWTTEEMPTLLETRIHAKCLRSVNEVRNYFRVYRQAKRADALARQDQGDTGTNTDGSSCPSKLDHMTTSYFTGLMRNALPVSKSTPGAVHGGVYKVSAASLPRRPRASVQASDVADAACPQADPIGGSEAASSAAEACSMPDGAGRPAQGGSYLADSGSGVPANGGTVVSAIVPMSDATGLVAMLTEEEASRSADEGARQGPSPQAPCSSVDTASLGELLGIGAEDDALWLGTAGCNSDAAMASAPSEGNGRPVSSTHHVHVCSHHTNAQHAEAPLLAGKAAPPSQVMEVKSLAGGMPTVTDGHLEASLPPGNQIPMASAPPDPLYPCGVPAAFFSNFGLAGNTCEEHSLLALSHAQQQPSAAPEPSSSRPRWHTTGPSRNPSASSGVASFKAVGYSLPPHAPAAPSMAFGCNWLETGTGPRRSYVPDPITWTAGADTTYRHDVLSQQSFKPGQLSRLGEPSRSLWLDEQQGTHVSAPAACTSQPSQHRTPTWPDPAYQPGGCEMAHRLLRLEKQRSRQQESSKWGLRSNFGSQLMSQQPSSSPTLRLPPLPPVQHSQQQCAGMGQTPSLPVHNMRSSMSGMPPTASRVKPDPMVSDNCVGSRDQDVATGPLAWPAPLLLQPEHLYMPDEHLYSCSHGYSDRWHMPPPTFYDEYGHPQHRVGRSLSHTGAPYPFYDPAMAVPPVAAPTPWGGAGQALSLSPFRPRSFSQPGTGTRYNNAPLPVTHPAVKAETIHAAPSAPAMGVGAPATFNAHQEHHSRHFADCKATAASQAWAQPMCTDTDAPQQHLLSRTASAPLAAVGALLAAPAPSSMEANVMRPCATAASPRDLLQGVAGGTPRVAVWGAHNFGLWDADVPGRIERSPAYGNW